ncbi:MAG: DUF4956 domain-containing protein [bacterium]
MTEILGLYPDFFDVPGISRLGLRLCIDLAFTAMVVLGVYVRRYGKNEYVFTYFMFNAVTFSLCFLLRKVPIELGFALGLFAVFGILRYRTEAIRTQDLTYLFVVIGLAILNAVANKKVSLGELLLVNSSIVVLTAVLDRITTFVGESSRIITYDDMDLVRSKDLEAVVTDLRQRTGMDITRISIQSVNLLRDTAQIRVYFPEDPN